MDLRIARWGQQQFTPLRLDSDGPARESHFHLLFLNEQYHLGVEICFIQRSVNMTVRLRRAQNQKLHLIVSTRLS